MEHRHRLWIALAVACALVAHGRSLASARFSYDDAEAIVENPVVRGDLPWTSVVDRDYWHHRGAVGHYRPTATASLRMDHALWNGRARGFRATNVVAFGVLVGLLAWLVTARVPGAAPLGVCLFAAHPALSDSVAWISGRTSLASALPIVAACAWLVRRPTAAPPVVGAVAFVAALLALGGKEDAVALLPALVLLAGRRRRALAAAGGATVALGVVLVARRLVYGAALPAAAGAPLADLDLVERLAFGGRALAEAARVAVWPFGVPPSYRGWTALAPGASPHAAWGLVSSAVLLVALGASLLAARRTLRDRPVGAATIGVCCSALALAPLTQVLPLGEPFAPRFLFLPLLCLAPLLVARERTRAAFVVVPLLAAWLGAAWIRAGDYADRASHARAVLARFPDDPVAWTSLGLALAEDGDADAAERTLCEAVERFPGHGRAWSNLASLQLERGELDAGIATLGRSLEAFPSNGVAWANLGNALVRRGDADAAVEAYGRAVKFLPGSGATWRGYGAALAAAGRPDEARGALDRALALDPRDALAARRRAALDR